MAKKKKKEPTPPQRAPLGQSKIGGQHYNPTTGERISAEQAKARSQPQRYSAHGVPMTQQEYQDFKRPQMATTPAVKEARERGEIPVSEREFTPERKVISREEMGEEARTLQKEKVEVAEETGVFEDRPERVELDVTEEERAQHPMTYEKPLSYIGRGVSAILRRDSEFTPEEIDDLIQDPETLRATMLQEIQREELDKSFTLNQKFGNFIEPYLGDLKVMDFDVGGYVNKWVKMPKRDVKLIVDQIKEMEGTVSGMTDSASQGEIGNPNEVMRDIASKEEDLIVYEGRIKRLILASDELKANPEEINLIESQILSARETFFEAKQRAGEGALITPSDGQLYLKLQKLRKGVENEE